MVSTGTFGIDSTRVRAAVAHAAAGGAGERGESGRHDGTVPAHPGESRGTGRRVRRDL